MYYSIPVLWASLKLLRRSIIIHLGSTETSKALGNTYNILSSGAWYFTPVMLALWTLGQESQKFKASLACIVKTT